MKIHILHLCHRIFSFYTCIQWFCHFLDSRLTSFFQNTICLTLCKNIRRICEISLFQCLSMTHKETSSLHTTWQTAFCKRTQETAYRHRYFIKRSMFQRFTIYVISFLRVSDQSQEIDYFSTIARMLSCLITMYSSSSSFTSEPANF